jgi:hypothetical protein
MRNESQAFARAQRADMVKAFIESGEYRQRFFGAPGGNQQGSQEAFRIGGLEPATWARLLTARVWNS